MPELSKGTIVAIALIAVIATGVALRSMGLLSFYNLSVISNGPYYPWKVSKAPNPGSGFAGADWQGGTEQSLVGGSGDAIRQFSDVLTYAESNYMVLQDFRATLATGVTVTGILARVNAQNSNCQDFGSTLVTALGSSGPGARKTTDLCAGNNSPLGGEQDSWGTSLTGADIDNPKFGIWIYATASAKNPNVFGHVTTVNVYSVSIMVYTSSSAGGGSFTITLYLNPTSGKPSTIVSGDVRTSPIQAGVTMYLQVRRAGTTTWQDLYSVSTDVVGSLNTKWSPDQYGLVQDGNYFYRVRSEDSSVYSNELIFAQSTSVIPPPPPGGGGISGITDNWTNLLAIGLLVGAVVVILMAIWHRKRS